MLLISASGRYNAGGSGGLTARSARRQKRKAPAKVKVEPGAGEDNKEGGTKQQKVRLRLKPRKPRQVKKRKSAQTGASKSDWYVLLVLFLVLHPSNHGRQTKRAVQTGAVLSSPPLSEVQAAQCEYIIVNIYMLIGNYSAHGAFRNNVQSHARRCG